MTVRTSVEKSMSVSPRSITSSSAILLTVRFRIDDPTRRKQNGYGDVFEQTFTVSAPSGMKDISRCLHLRQEGERLTVGVAADCRDSSYAASRQGGLRVPGRPK
jgi:hypothetical protein